MAQNADIKLLIGAAMTQADGGNSAVLIRETLQKALSGNNGIKVSVRIDEKSKQDIAKQIRGALQDINVSLTPSSTGTSKATDALKSEVASANNLFTKIGNIKKEINRITLELSKTEGDTSRAAGLRKELEVQLQYRKQYGEELGKIISKNPQILNDAKKYNDYLKQTAESTAKLETATGELADKHRNSLVTALKKEREEQEKSNKALQESSDKRQKIQGQFNIWLKSIDPRAVVEFKKDFDDFLSSVNKQDADGMEKAFENLRIKVKDAGYEGGNAFTYLHSKVKSFMTYLASSAFTMLFVTTFRNAKQAVLDLNKALVDLRMVTGGSVAQTEQLIKQYNKMAQDLGVTTTAITEAAVGWQRQGYNLKDTETLIRNSTILAKVGFLDAAEAQQYLTSMMKGYQISVEDSLSIVDKLAAVDTSAAVSAGGLAEAISKTANSARLAGVDLDTLIGYLAAVGEVTQQDMSSLGNAFKTMFARYSNVKLGRLEDDEGESLNDYETVLNSIGIALRNAEGEFRDFGEVWDEVVSKYAGLDNVTQSAIAQALGSTRQREGVLTLLDNIDNAAKYTEISLNSAGVAMEKFGAYEEGLDAKAAGMKAAFEGAADSIVPEGLIALVYDAGTVVAKFISVCDGLPAQLLSIAVAILAVNSAYTMLKASTVKDIWVKFIKGATDFGKGLVSMPKLLLNAARGTQSFSDGLKAMGVSASATQIAISALTAAISIGIILYQRHKQKVEEDRQAMEDAARSANEERESLSSLINEYKRLAESGNIDEGSRETVKNLQQQITDLVGDQANNLDLVNGKLDDQIAKLDEIAYKNALESKNALDTKKRYAESNYDSGIGVDGSGTNILGVVSYAGSLDEILKKIDPDNPMWNTATGVVSISNVLDGKNAAQVLEVYKSLQDLLLHNNTWQKMMDDPWSGAIGVSSDDILSDIQAKIDFYQGIIDDFNTSRENFDQNQAIIDTYEYLQKNDIASQEDFDEYVAGIRNSTEYSLAYKDVLVDMIAKTFPEFAKAAGLVTNSVEDSGSELNNQKGTTNSLKTALSALSDETTVLRDAMAKLGEGSAAFDKWIGSDDNLKSLLDKFPNLRDELEAYNSELAAGEDPQKAFITLQRAMNDALQDFNADKVYDGVNNVVDAFNDYGAGSNQVLQAVQNLDQYIPGLTNQLYSQDNAFSKLHGTTQLAADAFYEYCAAAIEAERASREIDISNLTTDLSDLAAMAMTAGHSMKEAMGLAKDEAYNRSGESFGIDDSMTKLAEWYETAKANLEGARNKWARSQSSKKSSAKEVYVPDVDPLYQYLQTVEDINDELDRLDIDEKLLDEDDFEGKNKLIETRIAKLEELKTALNELNNARDVEISTAVGKLNGYGDFQATYDAESGQALINNMDALKGLTGDTAKAAEELISSIENGSKAALSTSNEYMEALVEQNNLLKEQRELQEDTIDDRIERHRNAISLLQNQQGVSEGNLDYQAAVNSLKEQKSHWVEIQNIAHKMAEDIRAAHPGITDNDPLLKKWIDLWWEANDEIDTANEKFVENSLARLDSFIQQADNFNWWDNIDTTKVDMLEKKLETIHQLYADGIIPDAATYKKLVDETAKEIYDEKLNAIEQVIDYTKKLIEEEVRLRKEELEEQVDDYKKIVDLKKESLRASKEEADYQKSVAEKTKAIAKLQQQINTLALSDDRRDIAERKKLEEELSELQGDLADIQANHTLEAQEKALDDSYDAFEKEKNDEIKKLEATIDTEGKLYALAIERIDNNWDALYRDLMQMNSLYWDGIAGEAGIKGAWDTAKQAADGYKGTLETIQGIEKERASVSGTGTSVGGSVVSDKNAAYLTGDIDKQKELQAIGAQMQTNSQMWHTAYNANNKGQMEALQKANQRLAQKVKDITGQAPVFDSRDGYWKLANGEHFYEVYHGGGIVGSDEEFAKLQKGELVVPKDQVKPTMMMLEWGNSLASKMRGLFSMDDLVASAMTDAVKGAPLSPAAGAIVNNNAPSFAPQIQVEVKYDGSASPGDAKRFGENITAGIVEAFRRNGIGTGATPLLTGI